jgi:hypothetical protein
MNSLSCSFGTPIQKDPAGLRLSIKMKRGFMMKKRMMCTGVGMLLVLSLGVLTGCPTEAEEEENLPLTSLEGSVWAGETPQAENTGWLSIIFKENNKVICAFSADNTTNEWDYAYDKGTRAGSVSKPGGGWTPGDFTISEDGKTLTFSSYMGAARDYERLRSGDGVDPVPFTPGALPADLVNTVWGGETPRDGDWATFTFKTDGKAVASFAVDNTTNEWTYTYPDNSKSGSFSGGDLQAFTISNDGTTLVITTYYAHGPREFKRFR